MKKRKKRPRKAKEYPAKPEMPLAKKITDKEKKGGGQDGIVKETTKPGEIYITLEDVRSWSHDDVREALIRGGTKLPDEEGEKELRKKGARQDDILIETTEPGVVEVEILRQQALAELRKLLVEEGMKVPEGVKEFVDLIRNSAPAEKLPDAGAEEVEARERLKLFYAEHPEEVIKTHNRQLENRIREAWMVSMDILVDAISALTPQKAKELHGELKRISEESPFEPVRKAAAEKLHSCGFGN